MYFVIHINIQSKEWIEIVSVSLIKLNVTMAIFRLTFLLAISLFTQATVAATNQIKRKNNAVKKPNIMVIFADDVGTGDVPGYWKNKDGGEDHVIHMPNLKQLMNSGTTFIDAHATPLCATSRYVFLSGNYQHRGQRMAGVWSINYRSNQFHNGQKSIANVLRDNGYDTNMVGKWHIGGKK